MQHPELDRVHLRAGEQLFSAGDVGTAAYLIERGGLDIYLPQAGGDVVLATREAGEIVGEMAILDGRPRSAAARAREDTVLVAITEQQIAQRIDKTDAILRMLLGVVIERYRDTVALLGGGAVAAAAPERVPMCPAALDLLGLEREIRFGLQRAEFELFFQPIVRLRSRKLAGFEALIRWNHPTRGLLAPGSFIPVAEASGLIGNLTTWVLDEVGRVLPDLMTVALTHVRAIEAPLFMSVNVSGFDLARPCFSQGLLDLLERTGIHPSNLKLEVTESLFLNEPGRAASVLAAFRDSGMGVAIDDFGTGFSSLSTLSTLPVTTLKVDRAFVNFMLRDAKSRSIVETILGLAEQMALPVVAEGIETAAQAEALLEMGCDYGQGYLFGRPVPLAASIDLIRDWLADAEPRVAALA